MITFFKDAYFDIFVTNPPNYASIAILYESNELEIEEHSANTPCLSVSWPTEDRAFDESDHILTSFEATDADGDELSYSIYYSTEGGKFYRRKQTAAIKNSLLSAMISTSFLKSSDRARLAISVTDGERYMVWESPIFALPGYVPEGEDTVDSDVFSGSVSFSPDGSPRQVSVDPVHSMPRSPVSLSAGEYILELLDAAGTVLRSEPFSVSEESVDIYSTKFGEISSVSSQASFDVIVSNPPDYARFRISHSGKEISVFDRSQNAPSLSLNGPSERQRFANDDTIALSWTGNDLDGDELDYIVYYSTDGGTSYNVISQAGNRTSINFDDLDGSGQTRFAVSVSDGTRSTFVETPVFTVDNHPPLAEIISPASSSVLADEQDVVLKGLAYDKEDGSINSYSFSWSSSIDGSIGIGDSITSLSAADFTEGNHIITLTVTDSNGATATATTDITIKHRQNQLPIANDDIIRVAPDDRVLIDVLANDIDVEGDFDPETLAIFDHPVLGTAEIAKNEYRELVIAYTAGSPRNDYFTYLICDEIDCDIAQVTVTITTDGCTILGTEQDDTLRGTPGNDVICGLGGNDTIYGGPGDDTIRTGLGNDTIYGQSGNDLIYSEAGDDTIHAGEGDDIIKAGLGDDIVDSGPGDDTIYGEAGDDTIDSGPGDDIVRGGDGNDDITGGDGADELYGGLGDDILDGGAGNDTIHGSKGDDTIYGGPGDDTIRGNLGADTIYPGEGNDTLEGSTEPDTIIQ